jgi:hypothetical protein
VAGGQQINSGQGTLTYDAPASDAVTGSESTASAGNVAKNRLHPLRSRKLTGGAATKALTGQALSASYGALLGGPGAVLSGLAVSTQQGAPVKQTARLLTGIAIVPAQTNIGSGSPDWAPNAVTFTQGTSGTSQLPLPSGYVAGGFYQVASGSMPSGVTLSDSGLLTYDGVGDVASASITFAYTEPGALPTLTLHVGTGGTSVPYMATVYPVEGAVPDGYLLSSAEDSSLRASVLSRWPDDSAQVMVLAGRVTATAGAQVPITLRPAVTTGTNLTTSAITAAVSSVSVNFGTPLSLTITTTNHDWIWWANPQVICARYRLPITNKGSMEAVIDIHAFAGGRAFVEVVIENGKVNANGALSQASLDSQVYTNAKVYVTAVGGTQTEIASVSSPSAGMAPVRSMARGGGYTWTSGHKSGRAWYCAGEVSGTTVTQKTADTHYALFGIEVTHDTDSLQAHPWGFKPAVASAENMATKYEQTYDRYEPWSTGRLRLPYMANTGGDEQLTGYTAEQSDYIVTGSKLARRAVISHGLSCLTMGFNWRHTDGRVPTFAQIAGKCYRSIINTWYIDNDEPAYGSHDCRQNAVTSHLPQIAFYPFLCRPSPCFIEVAQKEFCWQVLGNAPYLNDAANWAARGLWNGQRSLWNSIRNYAVAAFLTPGVGPSADTQRKSDIASAIYAYVAELQAFYGKPWNTLNVVYGGAAPEPNQTPLFPEVQWYQMQYGAQVMPMVAGLKLLPTAQQTDLETVTTEHLGCQVDFINSAIGGEWRAIFYYQYYGDEVSPNVVSMESSFQATNRLPFVAGVEGIPVASGGRRYTLGPTVPAERGKWFGTLNQGTGAHAQTWAFAESSFPYNTPDYEADDYVSLYVIGLVRAVEFGVPGAEEAWTRVFGNSTRGNWDANAGITNLATMMPGFGLSPRQNTWPRNKA